MIDIRFENVEKSYGNTVVIPNIDFNIEAGERLVFLGPSGCGKSTLLRMVAGLESITGGKLFMGDREVTHLPPAQRDVAMVFQNYALYPHMSVEENITYALKVNNVPKNEIQDRLEYALEALELKQYQHRKPHALSGGQRQRVALARATVKRSKAFLLDEPLSNLDVQLRVHARQSMLDIHKAFGQTMVYVTHDQIEAMTFGTKVILLKKGEIQMHDTPYNVYHYPRNVFTAKFIGSPAMNLLEDVRVSEYNAFVNTQDFLLDERWQGHVEPGKFYTMGIRPEYVTLHTEKNDKCILSGNISHVENLGANYAIYIKIEGQIFVALRADLKNLPIEENDVVHLELQQDHLHFFDKSTELNIGRPQSLTHKNLMK